MQIISNKRFPQKLSTWLVLVFFIILFVTGASIHDDFGLTYDEDIQRSIGVMNARYITGESQDLLTNHHRIYGPFFEIFLVLAERIVPIDGDDTRSIFHLRHLLTFLAFFVSTIAFYFTGLELFQKRRWAFLGTLFLVLSPRIFAHSFYNSKDLAFLALFTIATFTMVKIVREKKRRWIVLHALCTAWAIDIRVMGIVLPLLTVALMVYRTMDRVGEKKGNPRLLLTTAGAYLALVGVFTVMFWPFLWSNPIHNFAEAFREMRSYPWPGTVLYQGEYVKATDLPWHYIPVWMALTIPLVYSLGFLLGSFISAWSLFRGMFSRKLGCIEVEKQIPLFLFWGSLLTVILSGATLYDGWRHMFYLYPSFILLSVGGYKAIAESLTSRISSRMLKPALWVSCGGVSCYLLFVCILMIQQHPHQNVYFNCLAGNDKSAIRSQYEMDYWGGSYRQGLEYIARNDSSETVYYYSDHPPGYINRAMLSEKDRKRFMEASRIEDADYFISSFRWHPEDYPYPEYYSITVGNAEILTIYRPNATDRK